MVQTTPEEKELLNNYRKATERGKTTLLYLAKTYASAAEKIAQQQGLFFYLRD